MKCKACGGSDTVRCSYADYVHPDGQDFPLMIRVEAVVCRECGATTDTGEGVCERNVLSGPLGCTCIDSVLAGRCKYLKARAA